MALTHCPDCHGPVSTAAPTCPGCGRPMGRQASVVATPRGTRTIEATGKPWKLCQLLGVIGILVAVGWFILAAQSGHRGPENAMPIVLGVVAVLAYLAGRVGAWWFHG